MSINTAKQDTRFVYGATCVWFGPIKEIGLTASRLPCCPRCGGMLFELSSEDEWWEMVKNHDMHDAPGYEDYVRWIGEHFRQGAPCGGGRPGSYKTMLDRYEQDTGKRVEL